MNAGGRSAGLESTENSSSDHDMSTITSYSLRDEVTLTTKPVPYDEQSEELEHQEEQPFDEEQKREMQQDMESDDDVHGVYLHQHNNEDSFSVSLS